MPHKFLWINIILIGLLAILIYFRGSKLENVKPPNIYSLKSNTVMLFTQDENGDDHCHCAGVWVDRYAFLTANHCVMGNDWVKYLTYDNRGEDKKYLGIVVKAELDSDLALVYGYNGSHTVAKIGIGGEIGDQVWVMGHPERNLYTLVHGILASRRKGTHSERVANLWQVDGNIGPGDSGGGMFNGRGELIGICSFINTRGARFGFFPAGVELLEFIENN